MMGDQTAPEVLFYSDTDVPTEFVFDGETIINFGVVVITAMPAEDVVP